MQQAIEYEVRRQIELIEDGGKVVQETRLYDPDRGETRSMRSKEDAQDYRYFPDPDLLPLEIAPRGSSVALRHIQQPSNAVCADFNIRKLPRMAPEASQAGSIVAVSVHRVEAANDTSQPANHRAKQGLT
jgi:hypothetical protein